MQSSLSQARETLSDLISQATDIENACLLALNFILEFSGRPSGALMLISSPNALPDLIIHKGLSISWAGQFSDPNSPLNRIAQTVYVSQRPVSGEQASQTPDSPTRFAAALPILAADPQMLELDAQVQNQAEQLPSTASDQLHNDLLGVLILRGEPCSPEEVNTLLHLMPPIGRAILISRWQSGPQARARHLAALQTEFARLALAADPEALQVRLLQAVCQILDCQASLLVFFDDSRPGWMVRKSLGSQTQLVYHVTPRDGAGLLRDCLRTAQPICVNNLAQEPRFDPSCDSLENIEAASTLIVPLFAPATPSHSSLSVTEAAAGFHEQPIVIGAIQALNKRFHPFDQNDQDSLAILATLATAYLHALELNQQNKIASADLEASRWELFNSTNILNALFNNLPFSVYTVDKNLTLTAVNQARAQLVAQEAKSLVGQYCFKALFNRSDPCPACRVQESLTEGRKTQRVENRSTATEQFYELEISSFPVVDENDHIQQAILIEQDQTERRRLEAILAQSEKLAALGQLAASVAHEINNPLTAIIANAQILHRDLPPESDLQESVDLISRAGARATQVVRNLLDFARKEDGNLALTNINSTIQRALELLQHELVSRNIRLTFQPDPQLPDIRASQDHLQSLWLNLILNAIDALDKTPGEIQIYTAYKANHVTVTVQDNGKGIPAEQLPRIFDPFFTTKAPGRGTGLGLSVSDRIVKQHGGHIQVESQVGLGSTFTVLIPCS